MSAPTTGLRSNPEKPTLVIESKIPQPTIELLRSLDLAGQRLRYSSACHVLYFVHFPYKDHAAFGVFGDGNNGCYEWFIWEDGRVETSDQGWGCSEFALQEAFRIVCERGHFA